MTKPSLSEPQKTILSLKQALGQLNTTLAQGGEPTEGQIKNVQAQYEILMSQLPTPTAKVSTKKRAKAKTNEE